MNAAILTRGVRGAGGLLILAALVVWSGLDRPAAQAQARRDGSEFVLLDAPGTDPRGIWCPPPDTVLTSSTGRLRAVNYARYGRGKSELLANTVLMIFDEYRLINAVVNLVAVAWEPGGEKLLVHETTLDAAATWFILDVGEGQYDKTGPDRLRTALGRRSLRFVAWDQPEEIRFRDDFTGRDVLVPVR